MDSLIKDPEIRLRKKLGNNLYKLTVNNINKKSLSIIQRTQLQNLQIQPTYQYYQEPAPTTPSKTESVFNFYINEKIAYLLGTATNTESARETFYNKLIQNSSLPTNYNFASIITEINKEIEHHIQQRYSIIYASKDKGKLQIPVKHRVESPTNPSYHYTPGSTINIASTGASTSNDHMAHILKDLNHDHQHHQDFDHCHFNQISEPKQEKEEEESEDQEFTYQNPIPENPKFKTPNIQTSKNPNQENPEIKMPNFQPPQQPNLDPIAYTPIAKLDNFISKEDDAQVWLNDVEKAIAANRWNNTQAMQVIPYFLKDTTDSWYQSLINKPQDFNIFKVEFLRYFSNNNSINCLVNTFTTIKQGETEAVTTYLECFHRNLCQIQAINANYFTTPQILNQFIHGLHSSILQHVHLLHLGTLQDAVTHTRDFESAELKANHTQAINLVMNRLSELDSKLEKFSKTINQKIERYLETLIIHRTNHVYLHQPINSDNKKCISATIVEINIKILIAGSNFESSIKLSTISNHLPADDAATNLSTISISKPNLSTTNNLPATATSNILTTATSNLLASTINPNTTPKSSSNDIRRSQIQNHPKLEISNDHSPTNSQLFLPIHWIMLLEFGYWFQPKPKFPTLFKSSEPHQQITLTNNIPPATITNNESLATIFLFELEETTTVLLFSGAALKEKPITAMYTNAKVNGHFIKLILDSESAGSIITRQLMDQLANGATKTSIREINNLSIEVNGIIIPIKVLVMEATQYQALIGNNWLSKAIPAICGHFKSNYFSTLLIELEEEKLKPTWEVYQVLWANNDHNKLLPILFELTVNWEWEEDKGRDKGKGKEKDTTQANNTYIPNTYTPPQQFTYR
ncbi:hypothetical protein G9A89_002806 [Geosiphon pyriformis]|nr:hypothetical protein G9A89_002806 [Geosiphon pyriformis]